VRRGDSQNPNRAQGDLWARKEARGEKWAKRSRSHGGNEGGGVAGAPVVGFGGFKSQTKQKKNADES